MKTIKAITKKSIACLLILGIIIQLIPSDVYASDGIFVADLKSTPTDASVFNHDPASQDMTYDENGEKSLEKEPQNYYEEEECDGEIVSASEESVTYQKDEKHFITEIGGTKKVYSNDEGNYELVDNTLVESEDSTATDTYENKSGEFGINLPACITENNGVIISKDDYSVELTPLDGDFSNSSIKDNAILYCDVFDGVDYQYTILGDMVKEDIVLNKPVDIESYRFSISSEECIAEYEEGVICISDKDTKEVIFNIVAPEIIDASGEVSNGVFLTLEENEEGFIATITVDDKWLNEEDRAYPVRIDPTVNVDSYSIGLYGVEQGSPDIIVGDNNYPYSGYDDGIATQNISLYGKAHLMTRTYVDIDYDFTSIDDEARIDSATFSLYHYTAYSGGYTNFGLYSADDEWDPSTLTWNSQESSNHTFIEYQYANSTAGYINWDVKDIVNDWVTGISDNNGFVVKAENERNMQCEVFYNKNGVYKPKLTIEWSIPDPVDVNYPLDSLTVNVRPVTEKNISGKLKFDAVFSDGIATPKSTVTYNVEPKLGNISEKTTTASSSYKYPDTSVFKNIYSNGTKYKDKVSNWQSALYSGFSFDKKYAFTATAEKNGSTSSKKKSDSFLIYKVKQTDTFPYIANYYGVSLNTIMRDNRVQDTLVIENNTIFIRNPQTEKSYTPDELSEDEKRSIDSSLMGRGLHCEYGYEPVNLNTGNFYYSSKDVSIEDLGWDFSIERTYNSEALNTSSNFGRKWCFNFEEYLTMKENGDISYNTGDGKILDFKYNGAGGYASPAGYYYQLTRKPVTKGTGKESYITYEYEIEDKGNIVKKFNTWGLLSEINNDGVKTSLVYDDAFLLKSVKSPSGKLYTFIHDTEGRVTEIKLPNSSSLKYEYGSNGDLTKYTNPDGNTVRYTYDNRHHMINWYDGNGNRVIQNRYDSLGRVISQTDANGGIATFVYSNNKTVTTDANGNKTIYEYDNNHRTTRIIYDDGYTKEMSYDSNNNLASDERYVYSYDSKGNLLSQTRKDGRIKSYTYDNNNNVTSIKDFNEVTTNYKYSNKNDLVEITYSDGSSEEYIYNNYHQLLKHTNENGDTESFSYDGANLSKYSDYNNNTTKYSYDNMNRLITTIYPDETSERTMYSASGNIIGQTLKNGGYISYAFDKADKVIEVQDPMGYVSKISYDSMNNITKTTDTDGNSVRYCYDNNNNIIKEYDKNGYCTDYIYDSRNRLVSQIRDAENTKISTKYEYDNHDNVVSITEYDGSKTEFVYDESLDEVVSTTDSLGYKTEYVLDEVGNILEIHYPNGTSESYVYNERGWLSQYVDKTGLKSVFEYDYVGNLIDYKWGGRDYSYSYDKTGHLTNEVNPIGDSKSYEYDSVGNCIQIIYEDDSVYEYTYNEMGDILTEKNPEGYVKSCTYDLNGNIIEKKDEKNNTTQYTYSSIGELLSYEDTLGNVTNYRYDSKSQLILTVDSMGGKTEYSYDYDGQITEVIDAEGNKLNTKYNPAGYPTEIKLSNGDVTIISYDSLGQITSKTDPAGLKTNYKYDSVGNLTNESDNAGANYSYKYDQYGRLVCITDVLLRTENYTYNKYSELSKIVDVDTIQTNYKYDNLGRLIENDIVGGAKEQYCYDKVGRVIKVLKSGSGIKTQTEKYEYNKLGYITKAIDAEGNISKFICDEFGNITEYVDGNGAIQKYDYDSEDNLIKSIDGNGNACTYEYDALYRLIKETKPNKVVSEYNYDLLGNMVAYKNPENHILKMTYDIYGNLTSQITDRSAKTEYKYDKHSNVIEVVDALGYSKKYDVNLNNNVTRYIQEDGSEYSYSYDAVNRLTEVKTPNGYDVKYKYDKKGNVSQISDNMNRTTSYEYDQIHNLTKETDAEGKILTYEYDAFCNLKSVIECNGARTNYNYDMNNRVISAIDPYNAETKYQYDALGNVLSITEAGSRKSVFEYDSNNNLTSYTSPMGNKTEYRYDTTDNLISIKDAIGDNTSYKYDKLGRVIEFRDTANQKSSFSYDSHDNIISFVDKRGEKTNYTYDLRNQLTKVTSADKSETKYQYDKVGNLVSETDALGNTTKYKYDKEQNLIGIISPDNNKESMAYDLAGNLKELVYPDGSGISYDYNKVNQLVEKYYQDVEGNKEKENVVYGYNSYGERISMEDSIGESSYEYDLLGRVTSYTNGKDKTINYSYDIEGRINEIEYSDGSSVEYEYDKDDNLKSVISSEGKTEYFYDALDRMVKVVRPDGSETNLSYGKNHKLHSLKTVDSEKKLLSSFEYSYDNNGYVIKEETEKLNNEEEYIKSTREYAYNSVGEITAFTEKNEDGTLEYKYSYDKCGNRTRLVISGCDKDETIDYKYNSSNQLITSSSSLSGTIEYEYDLNGCLISETNEDVIRTYEYTVEKRLSIVREGGDVLIAACYDGDGDRVFTASRIESDYKKEEEKERANRNNKNNEDGVLHNLRKKNGQIDDEQNEIEMETKNTDEEDVRRKDNRSLFWYGFSVEVTMLGNGVNSTEGFVLVDWIRELWNDNSSLLARLFNDSLSEEETDTSYLQNAGLKDDEIEELLLPSKIKDDKKIEYSLTYYVNDINRENTEVLQTYNDEGFLNDYIYGNNRISSYDVVSKENDYYFYDGQGSVTQVYNPTELIKESYNYDPYGSVIEGAPDYSSFYGYNAEETNSVTNLQYLRARYYSPITGRFGSKDVISTEIGTPLQNNRYIYARNNPNYYVDPSGNSAGVGALIGAAAGTIVGAVTGGVKIAVNNYKSSKGTTKKNTSQKNKKIMLDSITTGTVAGMAAGATYTSTKNVLATGAAAGAAGGFMSALNETKSAKEVVKSTAIGAGAGTATGAAIKVVSKAGSLVVRCAGIVGVSVAVGSVNRGVSTYAKTKSAKQSAKAAFDVPEMVGDCVVGLASLVVGYAASKATPVVEEYVDSKSCGSASSVTPQAEVQDPIPKVEGGDKTPLTKPNSIQATDKKVNTGSSDNRPTWRQSELDAKTDFPEYDEQVSFLEGDEVSYGTKGSVRPDFYKEGSSIDIKNYNVETASGRSSLVNNISKQYYQRQENLPQDTEQSVLIDIRGQNVSQLELESLYNSIMEKTNNGVKIYFKTD